MWVRREWVISICFHLIMVKAGQNGAIAQAPDEKLYVSSTLGMSGFQNCE
jgi:hypothetical protein